MPRETYYSNNSNQKEKYFSKSCSRLVLRRKDTAVFLTNNARPIFLQLLSDFIYFLKNSSNRRIIHKYLKKDLRLNSDGHISIKYFWKYFFINPLLLCWGYFHLWQKNTKSFENHLNPVMLVFIGKLSLSDEYPHASVSVFFSAFLHHFCDEQISHQQPKV